MSSLSFPLKLVLEEELARLGDPGSLEVVGGVGGGCINQALHLRIAQKDYFLKWNPNPLPGMFPAEAMGLTLMAESGTIRIPQVITFAEKSAERPAFLLLEWIDSRGRFDQTLCGEGLAHMHLAALETRYGLETDNYIGSTPQVNTWETDWIEFFRHRRLIPQMNLAAKHGFLPRERRLKLEKLIDSLEQWLEGVPRKPSLLHGDLWGGNVISGPVGEPVLIDPAVYFGDREAEIAFTGLFGGFSERFYQAYQAVYPLEPGYAERFRLYNLYHLLNHLNLFGEGYGGQVDGTLSYFVG